MLLWVQGKELYDGGERIAGPSPFESSVEPVAEMVM
jgi:hypothetical protein